MSETNTSRQGFQISSSGGRGLADRLIIGVLLLLIIIGAAVVFLTSLGILSPAGFMPYGDVLERTLRFEGAQNGLARAVTIIGAAIVGLIGAMLLARRSVPGRMSSSSTHVLAADENGVVIVDKRGVSTVASAAARRVAGVVNVEITVVGAGAAPVRLVIKTWVHAGADLAKAGNDVRDKASKAVEELVGLEVQDVLVKLEVVPLEELGRIVQ